MQDLRVRPWRAKDFDQVDALLDQHPDPYWAIQRANVHGRESRDDCLAATLVAEHNGDLVGAATMYDNPYHPGRYPAIVEVAPDWRRQGIGRLLTKELLDARPAPRPLSVRLRDADETAGAFARSVGMTTYQHCPAHTVHLQEPAVARWAATQTPPADYQVLGLSDVSLAEAVDAVVDLYVWQHAAWSPVGDRDQLRQLWTGELSDADPTLSSVAIDRQGVCAVTLMWADPPAAEAISETITPTQPDATALVTACLARSLAEAINQSLEMVAFDGHDDDPHFMPAMDLVPGVTTDPISLLQLA